MTHSSLNIAGAQSMRCAPRRQQAGFTLIEIMIVVLIIGVLMAIAYPSYQNHLVKTRRATAAACMMEAAQFMERHYTTRLSYLDPATNAAPALPAMQCRTDLAKFYTIQLAAGTQARSYTLEAVPKGQQTKDNAKCGTLSVTSKGVKSVSASGVSAASCF